MAVYSEADRAALHVRLADEACRSARRPRARATCASTACSTPPARAGPTPSTPATASSPRTRTSPARARRRASSSSARARETIRAHGREDLRPARGGGGRGAGGAGHPRAARRRGARAARGGAHRLPGDAEGRGGRRRQGHAPGARRRRRCRPRSPAPAPRRRAPSATTASTSRRRSLQPAPRRDPGAGRRPRQRRAPVRARVLDPAPAPEGHRGEPLAAPDARAARADGRARRGARAPRRLRQRRHARVPGRRGPRALLPRDEHPPAGRAPGDRDGDRPRPGAAADPRRRRESRCRCARRTSCSAGTPSSAASTPRIPTPASCRAPGRIVALRTPGGPGVRDDSGVYEGWTVPIDYDPLLSKLVAWGETREEAIARLRRAVAEYRVLGIRTTLPFFERVLRHPDFLRGRLRHLVRGDGVRRGDASARASRGGGDRGRRDPRPARAQRRGAPRPPPRATGLPPWRLAGRREAQGRQGS